MAALIPAKPAHTCVDAVACVLDDSALLKRILWEARVLGVHDICAAACVRRSWRDAARDDAEWQRLLLATQPSAAALEGDLKRQQPGAYMRNVLQLYRTGAASPPLRFGLQDYTVLLDVTDETGAFVACAAMPLNDPEIKPNDYAYLRASTIPLPDGGAAAASFLARMAQLETDTRNLRLRLLLRRSNGAMAVLADSQKACRFEDDEHADDPQYDMYTEVTEHAIWEHGEDPNSTRRGAVTWHSGAGAVPPVTRLFERPFGVSYGNEPAPLPTRWTWRVQFPAPASAPPGAATQLTQLTLRIGLRVTFRIDPDANQYASASVTQAALLQMLERRDAETDALWTTL